MVQFGSLDNSDRSDRDTIMAWGGHIESGYTFPLKSRPRLFTGYAFGSGDNDTEDTRYTEFHGNVYNDNYMVGDTSLIPDVSGVTVGDSRASGMHIFISGFSFNLTPKLNFNLDNHYFWANKTPTGISGNLGDEINVIATYEVSPHCNIMAGANRFFTGKFFKDAMGSGKDISYFYLQTQIDF